MEFCTGFCVSLGILTVFLLFSLVRLLWSRAQDWLLSALQIFTVGAFAAVLVYFLPVCHVAGKLKVDGSYILEAIHTTLRVFVVDIDFEVVQQALAGEEGWLLTAYQWLGAVLYLLAPVLLFTNLMMLVRDILGELRFLLTWFRPIYLFSELNARSIALAEDIYRHPPKTRYPRWRKFWCRPVLVFTEVYAQNRERDQELLSRAGAIHAICLKKDVARLKFYLKYSRVEMFLIGEKEEENVSQAMIVTEKLSKSCKNKVQIYVFSRKESDGCILDSVDYGKKQKALERRQTRLSAKAKRQDKNRPDQDPLQVESDRYAFSLHDGKSFSLRRVDVVQHLIWDMVPEMKLLETAEDNGGELSVLIAGFGSYGQEFFKMLLWFCQYEGHRLKVTVVDKEAAPGAEGWVRHHCPELLAYDCKSIPGDACYDIQFLNMDVRSGEFAQLLSQSDRLKKTNVAFVAMGDDDLNVETAMYLRCAMDRVKGFAYPTPKKDKETGEVKDTFYAEMEPVQIYAVVFDEMKSSLLRAKEKSGEKDREAGFFLKNHKEQKLHIRFVGGLQEQFRYHRITWQALEAQAYYHHCKWEEIDAQIRKEKENKKPDADTAETLKRRRNDKLSYHKFEYYRNSSIATTLYSSAVRGLWEVRGLRGEINHKQTCECENCLRRKRSEHMRWNAYMRVCGWCYGEPRNDRAKLHNDMVPWDKLKENEKKKD